MATRLMARQGRHRQLYEDNFRLVSGATAIAKPDICKALNHWLGCRVMAGLNCPYFWCIPFRVKKGYEDYNRSIQDSLEVLMISSPDRNDLVFPKGGWENDETVHEAACREALEEAGVRGILNKNQLGVWEFRSKSRQEKSSLDGGCRGYMFALEVTEELDTWAEQVNHGRKWLDVEEAFKLCRYEWMKEALRALLKQMAKDKQPYDYGIACYCIDHYTRLSSF